MSLNALPEEIVALIGRKLPFEDRLNLMETSKRYERIVRRAKMDRKYNMDINLNMEAKTEDDSKVEVTAFPYHRDMEDYLDYIKIFTCKLSDLRYVFRMVTNKEIRMAGLKNMKIISELTPMIEEGLSPNTSIYIDECCFEISKAEFLSLIRKVRIVFFNCFTVKDKEIISDEVFFEILSRTSYLTVDQGHITTPLTYGNLSDKLLQAVSQYWPSTFFLGHIVTEFSLELILDLVKKAHFNNKTHLRYSFGLISKEYKADFLAKMEDFKRKSPGTEVSTEWTLLSASGPINVIRFGERDRGGCSFSFHAQFKQ